MRLLLISDALVSTTVSKVSPKGTFLFMQGIDKRTMEAEGVIFLCH